MGGMATVATLTIGEIVQEIVALFGTLSAEPTAAEWEALTGEPVAEAERRIAELRHVLDDLGSGEPLCSLPGVGESRGGTIPAPGSVVARGVRNR